MTYRDAPGAVQAASGLLLLAAALMAVNLVINALQLLNEYLGKADPTDPQGRWRYPAVAAVAFAVAAVIALMASKGLARGDRRWWYASLPLSPVCGVMIFWGHVAYPSPRRGAESLLLPLVLLGFLLARSTRAYVDSGPEVAGSVDGTASSSGAG